MSPAHIAAQRHARTSNGERPLDRRIARSCGAIEQALMDLLAEGRPFEKLTVSEVASRAGLTRKTFYARFGSIDAVVLGMASGLFKSILLAIPDEVYTLPLAKLPHVVLARLHEEHAMFEFLTTLCPSHLFLEAGREAVGSVLFERILGVNDLAPISDFDRDFLIHLLSTTLHGSVTAWASRGFRDSSDAVADFAAELLGPICGRVFRPVV